MNVTGRRDPNDDDEDRGHIEPADLKDENGNIDPRKVKSQNSNNPSEFACTAKQCSEIRREMAKDDASASEVAEKVSDFNGNHPHPSTVREHARGAHSCPSPEPIVEYHREYDEWIQRGDEHPTDDDHDGPGAHVLLNIPRNVASDMLDDLRELRDDSDTDVPYDKLIESMEGQL